MATATIELDEKTATALRSEAQARQLPLALFLKEIADHCSPINQSAPLSDEQWNQAVDEASGDFQVLRPDFNRGDIYSDHD